MAGRPREPVDLIKAKGRKHLTKNEYEERKSQELDVPFVDVKAPTYLNTKQKRKFNDIAKKLVALGIMTELDVDCLARYVISHDLYILYTEQITQMLAEGVVDNTMQNLQDKAFRQAQTSARDLGLTITSRCKLVMPTPPDDDDDEL